MLANVDILNIGNYGWFKSFQSFIHKWKLLAILQESTTMTIKAIFLMMLFGMSFSLNDISIEKPDPKKLYKSNCRLCHGAKGKLGIGGASDLSKSNLSLHEAIKIIKEGKGSMTPFEGILTDKEIKSVAKYIQTLKS